MQYLSTTQFESKVIPGVVFQFRKMSHGRRIKLNVQAAAEFAKIQEKSRRQFAIQAEIKRATVAAKTQPCTCPAGSTHEHSEETWRCREPDCDCRKPEIDPEIGGPVDLRVLDSEIFMTIVDELYPQYIIWGVSSISGLDIDGVPATPRSLIDDGPEQLVAEVGNEIHGIINMTPEEVLGFKLPTTSGAPGGGGTTNTTVPSASE